MNLQEFFQQHPRMALALSGGVDSAYLLSEAVKWGCCVQPYFVDSPFQPPFEREHAQRLCDELGVTLCVLSQNPLLDERVRKNDALRCYYCKQQVFGTILQHAAQDGYAELMDGTNASDDAADRPGMRALQELQVYSPLRICGLTKQQIRHASRERGLFTWNKPAYACLATRIAQNTPITEQDLLRVQQAEQQMLLHGYTNFRVRLHGDWARLELTRAQLCRAANEADQLRALLSPFAARVVLDLIPRKEEELPWSNRS